LRPQSYPRFPSNQTWQTPYRMHSSPWTPQASRSRSRRHGQELGRCPSHQASKSTHAVHPMEWAAPSMG
jgi:hypothetical protein